MVKWLKASQVEIAMLFIIVALLVGVKLVLDVIYDPKSQPVVITEDMELPEECSPDFVLPVAVDLYNAALGAGMIDQDYLTIVGAIEERWVIMDGVVVLQITLGNKTIIHIAVFAICENDGVLAPLIDVYIEHPGESK